MSEEIEGAEVQPEPEKPAPPVKDPEAVLKKNQELLGKLTKGKEEAEALKARIAEFEAADAERERAKLERKGEWETLRTNMEVAHKAEREKDAERYGKLFTNASRFELAVELSKHDVLDGTSERLAKLLLLDEIKPVEENDKVVWRKIATDEEVKLHEFIPSIQTAYGEFFKADNNPGGNAPGSSGNGNRKTDLKAVPVTERLAQIYAGKK